MEATISLAQQSILDGYMYQPQILFAQAHQVKMLFYGSILINFCLRAAYVMDGVNVIGFVARSLLDGFEWDLEYEARCDRPEILHWHKMTPKPLK